jgi:hypothetical protein
MVNHFSAFADPLRSPALMAKVAAARIEGVVATSTPWFVQVVLSIESH